MPDDVVIAKKKKYDAWKVECHKHSRAEDIINITREITRGEFTVSGSAKARGLSYSRTLNLLRKGLDKWCKVCGMD